MVKQQNDQHIQPYYHYRDFSECIKYVYNLIASLPKNVWKNVIPTKEDFNKYIPSISLGAVSGAGVAFFLPAAATFFAPLAAATGLGVVGTGGLIGAVAGAAVKNWSPYGVVGLFASTNFYILHHPKIMYYILVYMQKYRKSWCEKLNYKDTVDKLLKINKPVERSWMGWTTGEDPKSSVQSTIARDPDKLVKTETFFEEKIRTIIKRFV